MPLLKEFSPALKFLGKFLVFYFTGNLLYGLFIESYGERADPITYHVTSQTGLILDLFSDNVQVAKKPHSPTVNIIAGEEIVVAVFEGCNGLNVMIVFVAFLFAFGGPRRTLLWFLPAGLALIHFVNLGRIGLLYFVSRYQPEAFYFFHKYLFTAILYILVFALWFLWVTRFNGTPAAKANS